MPGVLVDMGTRQVLVDTDTRQVLAEIGGVCCDLPFTCAEGYTEPVCLEIGGRWQTGYTNCDGGSTGYGPCDCHCFSCIPGSPISGPTSVDITFSYTESTDCWDPPDVEAGSVTNKPFPIESDTCTGFSIDGDNYFNTCFHYSTGFPSCSISFGVLTHWPGSFDGAQLQLTYYCGPCGDAPIGWYLTGFIQGEHCSTSCNDLYGCGDTCVYLGNEDTFMPGVDVSFTVPLVSGGTLTGTFHTACS